VNDMVEQRPPTFREVMECRYRLNLVLDEISLRGATWDREALDATLFKEGRRIVVFGAGRLGQQLLEVLHTMGYKPCGFADNTPSEHGVCGLPVFTAPEAIQRWGVDAEFLVCIRHPGFSFREVRDQLMGFGVRNIHPVDALYRAFPEQFLPHYYLDRTSHLVSARQRILEAAELWAEIRSLHEYEAQIRYRALLEHDGLTVPEPGTEYFPPNLFPLFDEHTCFVDAGAFNGDTVRVFLRRMAGRFSQVIALEPDPRNALALTEYVSTLPSKDAIRIKVHALALSDHRGVLNFSATGGVNAYVTETGESKVPCTDLDSLLGETRVSYIKMDIEGSEPEALRGAAKILARDRPALAVCLYHRPDHLWEIPLLLRDLIPKHQFFLRPHDFDCWDTVCYAVPTPERN
jgi:FkbM family methyltransferase